LFPYKVRSLRRSDQPGASIDFGLGDEAAFRGAADKVSDFEANPSISSVVVRNVQSIAHPQLSMLLMGLSDSSDSVRRDAGVIFVADLGAYQSVGPKKGRRLQGIKMRRWSFSGVSKLCENLKPRFALKK
jgi:hypothetical protein